MPEKPRTKSLSSSASAQSTFDKERFEYALEAAARGWRVIPLAVHGKKPLISEWPLRASCDPNQIRKWAAEFPGCNWGVATGPQSGIFVVDADTDDAIEKLKELGPLPPTFTVETSKGAHLYLRYPEGAEIGNPVKKIEGIDIRGKNGQVVQPFSIHPSGAIYTIADDTPPAEAPEWLLKRLAQINSDNGTAVPRAERLENSNRVTKGRRNFTLTSFAGSLQRKGMSRDVVEAALIARNKEFDPPLEVSEVQGIVKSIGRYEPADPETGDIELRLGERPYAQMVPDAEMILKYCAEERIFQTLQNKLVRVVQHRQIQHPDKTAKRDPEACVLVDVDLQYLRLALGRTGRIRKYAGPDRGYIPTDAPRQLAEMILSSVTTSPDKTSWRRLKKISTTPILLLDASIVSEPGYHTNAKIWIDTRGTEFLDPAQGNPKLSAKQCRKLIEENIYPFLRLYPFAREQKGQHWFETGAFAVVLSAMMCLDDRHNLSAVPMHCVSAPTQSCGKTRLVHAIACAMTGTQPTIVTYDGPDEFAKHIPVLIGKGDSAICVDNIIMSVNNAKLAAMLTQEHAFTSRLLGQSMDVTVENVSVLFATGVNLQLSGDMPTRCLLARIEPEDERPEQKKFPFDQVERAKELFSSAVMAIKAVVRAHQLAGFPGEKKLKSASRFLSWDKRVRAAIVWAGYADPVITQEAIRADDPVRNENLRLLWSLRESFKGESFLVRHLSSKLSQDSLTVLRQITGHKDGDELNEKKVGKYFSHHLVGRWFEGIRLVRTGKNPGGRIEWRIEAKLDDSSFHVMEDPL
jgi:hypothetical protein